MLTEEEKGFIRSLFLKTGETSGRLLNELTAAVGKFVEQKMAEAREEANGHKWR